MAYEDKTWECQPGYLIRDTYRKPYVSLHLINRRALQNRPSTAIPD